MPLQNYNDPLGMEDLYDQEVQDNLNTGTIGRSFESGLHGMASSTNAAAAAVARVLGADKYAKEREQVAREQATRAAGSAEGVTKFGEIDSASGLGDWALGAFVSNAPLLGTMALTGAAGGVAGAAMRGRAGQVAVARKAAEREVANQLRAAAPGMSRKAAMASSMTKSAGELAAGQAAKRSYLRNAVSQGLTGTGGLAKAGRVAGGAVPYGLMTTGETYMGILNDPNASGTEKDQAFAAIMSGAGQAALGMAFEPVGVMQRAARIGRTSRTAAQQARREVLEQGGTAAQAAAAARKAKDATKLAPLSLFAATTLGEGATEAGEQAIQQFTQKQFNPEAGYSLSELTEAAAAGMVVGGGMAAPGAIMASIQNRRADRDGAPPVNADGTMQEPLNDVFENTDLPVKSESVSEYDADKRFSYGYPGDQVPGYVTLKDERTGDVAHIPDNAEALMRKAPVYLNGVKISSGALKESMTGAMEFGEELEPSDVFEAIRHGGQYAPVERDVQVVETHGRTIEITDEFGRTKTVDAPVVVSNESKKITTRVRPIIEKFGLSIAKIKPVDSQTQVAARKLAQKWLPKFETFKKKAGNPNLTLKEYLGYLEQSPNRDDVFTATKLKEAQATLLSPDATPRDREFARELVQQHRWLTAMAEDPQWLENSGKPLDQAGFQASLKALVDLKQQQGQVPVAIKDNTITFGTPQQRDALYAHLGIKDAIPGDANVLSRVGTLINRESNDPLGNGKKLKVPAGTRLHANDADTSVPGRRNYDGVLYKLRGQRLQQGTMYTVDGRAAKGAGGSPLRVRGAQYKVDENGAPIFPESRKDDIPMFSKDRRAAYPRTERDPDTGDVKFYDPDGTLMWTEEAESVNRDFEFGVKDAGQTASAADQEIEFYPMNDVNPEGADSMPNQGVMFNIKNPVATFRRNRAENMRYKKALEIAGDPRRQKLFDSGVPLGLLLHPEDLVSMVRSVVAPSSRAFAVPSALVEPGQLMLSPAAFKRLNRVLVESGHGPLEVGDTLNLDRQPSLPDASGFSGYTFAGIAEATNPQDANTEFVVTNNNDLTLVQKGLDFDGDRANIYAEQDWLTPKGIDTSPAPNFQAKGVKPVGETDAERAEAKAAAAKSPIKGAQSDPDYLHATVTVTEEDGSTVERDLLANALINSDLGFSQMIGLIMRTAQNLAEMGKLGDTAKVNSVTEVDKNGVPVVERIESTFAQIARAVGQASIDAKKKKAFAKEALEAFDALKKHATESRPIKRWADGTPVATGKKDKDGKPQYVKERTFTTWISRIQKAAVSVNRNTSEKSVERAQLQLSQAYLKDMITEKWLTNPDAVKLLLDGKSDLAKSIQALRPGDINILNPVSKLDNIYAAALQAERLITRHANGVSSLMRAANKEQARAVLKVVAEAYKIRDALVGLGMPFGEKLDSAMQAQYNHMVLAGLKTDLSYAHAGDLMFKHLELGASLEATELAEELIAEYGTLLNMSGIALPMTATQMQAAYEDQRDLMLEMNIPGADLNVTHPSNITKLWEANLQVGVAPEMASLAEDLYEKTGGRLSTLLDKTSREAFGDTLQTPMHTEMAYQVRELKRKADETRAFETPKLPPLVMDVAEDMMYNDGKMSLSDIALLKDLSDEHKILTKEINLLNAETDSELIEVLVDQRAEVAADIKIMYYTGRATAAGLIAAAPTHLALRTVHPDKFQEIVAVSGKADSFRMRLNTLDAQGRAIAPNKVGSGIYKLSGGKLTLQKFKTDQNGYFDPATAQDHPDDVVIVPQFAMTYGKDEIAPHAKLENDRMSALTAAAARDGGFVRVFELAHAQMSLIARLEAVDPAAHSPESLAQSKDTSMAFNHAIGGGGKNNDDFNVLASGVVPKDYRLTRAINAKTAWHSNLKVGDVVRVSPNATPDSQEGFLFFKVADVKRENGKIYVTPGPMNEKGDMVFYPGPQTNRNIPKASQWGLAVHEYKKSRVKLFNALNVAWAKKKPGKELPPEVGAIPDERQDRYRAYIGKLYKETVAKWEKSMEDVSFSEIRKYSKMRFAEYAPLDALGKTADWADISEAYREFILARIEVDKARKTGGGMAVPTEWKERQPLNNSDADTSVPDEENFPDIERQLKRLDMNLSKENRKKLQKVADGISQMFDTSSSATVVNATEYHAILLADGQDATAKMVRLGQNRGSYWRSPTTGEVVIYLAAPPGVVLEHQTATLMHELGHHLVLDHWEKLNKNRPDITKAVWMEFRDWAEAEGREPTQKEFHEWIADNVGAWLATDKEVKTIADSLFEVLAEILSTFYSYLRRTLTAQGQERAIEDSIFDFMEALRKSVPDQAAKPSRRAELSTPAAVKKDEEAETEVGDASDNTQSEEEVERTVDNSPVPATGTWGKYQRHEGLDQAYLASLAERAKAVEASVNSGLPNTIHDLKTIAEGTVRAIKMLMTEQDIDMLRRIVQQPDMRSRLNNLVGRGTEQARRMEYDPDLAVMYLYVFTRAGIMTAPSKVSESAVLNSLDNIVRNQSRQIQDASAEEVKTIIEKMEAQGFDSTTPLLDEESPGYRLYKNRQDRYLKGLNGGLQRVRDLYRKLTSWYVDVPYQRIIDSQRPTLIAAARRVQHMAWEVGGTKGAGYMEQMQSDYQTAGQRVHEIIADLSEEQQAETRLLLYGMPGAKASATARTAADKLRGVLKYMYQRESAVGLPVKERANYWPMILDHSYILENLDQVVKTFSETPEFRKGWDTLQAQYVEWMGKELATMREGSHEYHSQQEAIAKVRKMAGREFVAHYLQEDAHHGLPNTSLKRHPSTIVHTPGFRFMNPRALNFLLDSNSPALHGRVMAALETNMFDVAKRYIKASARRTAWQRFLNEVHPSGTVAGLIAEAKIRDKATPEEIDVFVRYLDAVNGLLGMKERDTLNGIFDAAGKDSWLQNFKSEPGELMNERINAGRQFTHMWTNITKLTLAAAAASVDPFGQLLRHGDGKVFAQSTKEAHNMLRTIAKNGGLDDMQKFLVSMGLMEHAMTIEDHAETYDGAQVEQPGGSNTLSGKIVKGTRTVQNKFFYYNGVEFITVRARTASGIAAIRSIIKWSRDAKSEDKLIREMAEKRLAELDLSADDVETAPYTTTTGEESELIKYLTFDERIALQNTASDPNAGEEARKAAEERIARDDRIRVAVHRQTNESTLRPDPTNRALHASNPYYSIFNVWKGFITAYSNQILRPAWVRLIEEGNATPLMWMALTFIPIMFFADMLRDAIKTGLDDDEDDLRPRWKDDWTFGDHVLYAVERAGFLGGNELVFDIIQPLSEGNVPRAFGEIAGVPVSDAMKMGEYGPGAQNLPGGDMWKNWG